MRTKTKNLVLLLSLGLFFSLIINNNFNLSDNQKSSLNHLKESASYIRSFIHIDGNWSATTSYDWCYGQGTWQDPYIIENVTIDASSSPTDYGIYIQNSNVFFIIQNCKIYNSIDYGIYLESVNNSRLIYNNCSNNYAGIALLYRCTNNTISRNIANDNDNEGIYFYEECYNNTISENTANNNGDIGISVHWYTNKIIITRNTVSNNTHIGIELYDYCSNNTISNNSANNNGERGIDLEYYCKNNTISNNNINHNGDFGLYLDSNCDDNIILENTINNNSYGIRVWASCDHNKIKENLLIHNLQYGICLWGGEDERISNKIVENVLYNNYYGVYLDTNSKNNTIYKNFFAKNEKHAIDDGTGNTWNSSTIGNYWDNHTGPDLSPEDGIVDNPYTYIDGFPGNIDYLPIAEDGPPRITINSPIEDERFGSTAPTFNVEIIDMYVFEMWYTLDGGVHNHTFTKNGTIIQSVWDTLSSGRVTITFYARDIGGNVAFEKVTVIKSVSAGGLDPGVMTFIVVISVIGGLAIIGAILGILIKKGKISLEKIKSFSFRKK